MPPGATDGPPASELIDISGSARELSLIDGASCWWWWCVPAVAVAKPERAMETAAVVPPR